VRIRVEQVDDSTAVADLEASGSPHEAALVWASFPQAVRHGTFAVASSVVPALTGRDATAFAALCRAQ
jgi:hypothetical protein